MVDTPEGFLTIDQPGTGIYREKGSKFFAYAQHLSDADDLKQILEGLKKLHPQARHFCYAWRLDAKSNRYRANDDGEPSNSAGTPILHQIQSQNLFETVVVVVRYFGGTKLGVSGLITAYKAAAHNALEAATTTFKIYTSTYKLQCTYPLLSILMQVIKKFEGRILHQEMGLDVLLTAEIPEGKSLEFELELPHEVLIFEGPPR